jgi:uncharacterized membrane protein
MKMKKPLFRTLFRSLLYSMVAILSLAHLSLYGRDYRISAVDINIWLEQDGSMLVEEMREFTFEGSFSVVYRTFPVKPGVTFSDFEVLELDIAYRETDRKEPGGMRVVERRRETEVQWFFTASDTTRTFLLRFWVRGAMERHEDVAVLYYQAISSEWEKVSENVTVQIHPPRTISADSIRQWWHGDYHIFSEINDLGVIRASLPGLPAGSLMGVRALYPSGVFTDMLRQTGTAAPGIIEEETLRTEDATARHYRDLERQATLDKRYALGFRVLLMVGLAYALFWIWLYKAYWGVTRVGQVPETSTTLPSEENPALVNYLMTGGQVTANAMAATIFHLASRRFIKIEEQQIEAEAPKNRKSLLDVVLYLDRDHWKTQKETLGSHENALLEFLFDKLQGTTDTLKLNDLKGHLPAMHQFFLQWSKIVKAHGATKDWFDQRSKKGRKIGLISTLVLLAILIPLVFFFGPALAFGFLYIFIGLILSSHIYRRTEKGEMEYRQWQALKTYLKQNHFDKKSGEKIPETFSDYVVYGTAMGLGRPFFHKLTQWLEGYGTKAYPAWIVIYTAAQAPNAEALNNIVTTTGGAFTTAIGGAGSMGGGAGVSSGGGGAR